MKHEQYTLFRPIKGYPGYAIGETGEVISFKHHKAKFKKPVLINCGYLGVGLSVKGKQAEMKLIHALVAEAFLGERPQGMQIDHIDGNRFNNHYTNLRYVTPYENIHNPATYGKGKRRGRPCRPVIACKDGAETRYESGYEAAKALGVDTHNIYACCRGRQHTTAGHTIRYDLVK